MDAAASGSSGAAGFDDEDGLAARREVSSSLKGTCVLPQFRPNPSRARAPTDSFGRRERECVPVSGRILELNFGFLVGLQSSRLGWTPRAGAAAAAPARTSCLTRRAPSIPPPSSDDAARSMTGAFLCLRLFVEEHVSSFRSALGVLISKCIVSVSMLPK
jgi:hypothetical protein